MEQGESLYLDGIQTEDVQTSLDQDHGVPLQTLEDQTGWIPAEEDQEVPQIREVDQGVRLPGEVEQEQSQYGDMDEEVVNCGAFDQEVPQSGEVELLNIGTEHDGSGQVPEVMESEAGGWPLVGETGESLFGQHEEGGQGGDAGHEGSGKKTVKKSWESIWKSLVSC